MLIPLAKIFSVIYPVLVIPKGYLGHQAKTENLLLTIIRLVTWLLITALAFLPNIRDISLGSFKANTGTKTVLAIGLICVYCVVCRIFIKADGAEKRLNGLTQELA